MNINLIRKIVQQLKNLPATFQSISQHMVLEINQLYQSFGGTLNPGVAQTYRLESISDVLTFAGQASINLTTSLPANARVKYATLNFDTAVVLATAVKVGVGIAATPNLFALSGTVLTKNTKTTNSPPQDATTFFAAAQAVGVFACATGGTAAGTITSGTCRVTVFYEVMDNTSDHP